MKEPTKPKHTPGPWQLFYMPFSDTDNGIDLKGNNGNTLIANFPTPVKTEGVAYVPGDEDAANLKLIAAAPELLEALQSVTAALNHISPAALKENPNLFSWLTQEMNDARAAIAKAQTVKLP